MDSVQEGVEVLGSALHVPADPVRTGFIHLAYWNISAFVLCTEQLLSVGQLFTSTHLRLTEHLDTVLTDELQQLAVREAEEFILLRHLGQKAHDQIREQFYHVMCFSLTLSFSLMERSGDVSEGSKNNTWNKICTDKRPEEIKLAEGLNKKPANDPW